MRLLRTDTGPDDAPKLVTFDREIPKYAILSHRSLDIEVEFEHIQRGTARERPESYAKITNAIRKAASDGHEYIWIDSCCIDKSSSAEHQEALNSMYAWYQKAEICYAILNYNPKMEGTDFDTRFVNSNWFTRGWTLQELLAPRHLQFFEASETGAWISLGWRGGLCNLISRSTSIHPRYLTGKREVHRASVAERMSWAAKREATRGEDMAYALLGLFSVNMPMLYGEGKSRAFRRLQEEIMKISDDQSIFAWMHSRPGDDAGCHFEAINDKLQTGELLRSKVEPNSPTFDFKAYTEHGLLADSPAAFLHSAQVKWVEYLGKNQAPYRMTNRGLKIRLNLIPLSGEPNENRFVADLNCYVGQYDYDYDGDPPMVGVYFLKLHPKSDLYARLRCDRLVLLDELDTVMPTGAELTRVYVRQNVTEPDDHFCGLPSAQLETCYWESCNADEPPRLQEWLVNG